MSRACVHIGAHSHLVKIGDDREAKGRLTTLLSEQVERTPFATNSAIVFEAGKEFVGELLLNPEGTLEQSLSTEELVPVFETCVSNLTDRRSRRHKLGRNGVWEPLAPSKHGLLEYPKNYRLL